MSSLIEEYYKGVKLARKMIDAHLLDSVVVVKNGKIRYLKDKKEEK